MIKVAFFGTSNKSLPILENLSQNLDLLLCVTKSDRVVGRKQISTPTVVKTWAQSHNVKVLEINSLDPVSTETIISSLKDLKVDCVIVADFSFIIPKAIISTPPFGLINIHFSELPKYRGASPIQHTILNGDRKTAITFMLMGEKMDEGDILIQFPVEVPESIDTGELYASLFNLAGEKTAQVVSDYVNGSLKPRPQEESKATYCYSKSHPKSTLVYKEDVKLDWHDSPLFLYRQIRAYNPWPIAWTTLGELKTQGFSLKDVGKKDLKLKIFTAKITNNEVLPLIVQPENGKKITFEELLHGYFVKG